MNPITESNIETFAIEVLKKLGKKYVDSLSFAPSIVSSFMFVRVSCLFLVILGNRERIICQ
jgi:hypothetical protein